MKVVSLANQKGGVAKTTSTYNLAAIKAKEGKRVLMIDLDPQCSLTISVGLEQRAAELEGLSTVSLFDKKIDPITVPITVETSKLDNLYIVPSDISLAVTEQQLLSISNRERQLKRAINAFEGYFDYVFIDCPPNLGTLLNNALTASTDVIIPVKTDYLSYRGLNDILSTIENIKHGDGADSLNPNLKVDGIIGTMYRKNLNDHQDVLTLLKKKGKVLGVVKESAEAVRTQVDGIPVVLARPSADVSLQYQEIAKQI